VLHTRPFISNSQITELDLNIIKNQDGTRTVIFVGTEDGSFREMDDGVYRLDFRFKRDIGSEAPLLKRFGFTDAEETSIEFSLPCLLPAV